MNTLIKLRLTSIAFVALTFCVTPMAFANDDFFADIEVSDDVPENLNSNWLYKGFVQQKFKYGIDTPDTDYGFERSREGLSQVRTDVFAELSGSINDAVSLQLSGKVEVDALQWENGEQQWQADNASFS